MVRRPGLSGTSASQPHGVIAESDCSSGRPITPSLDSVIVNHEELIPSDIRHIDAAVGRAIDLVEESGGCQDVGDVRLALHEALVNAIVHGNREHPQKRVFVRCRCIESGEVVITVEDEGVGFDCESVADCTLPDNLMREHGRGIYLIRTLMDDVRFEKGGSVIRMGKNSNATERRPQ